MATAELRSWALKGAEQRLVEIADETRAIYREFPQLRNRGRAARSSPVVRDVVATDGQEGPTKRRRRRMSRAARKKISDAQKARWAKQKARTK
jgi:hypothetical protein